MAVTTLVDEDVILERSVAIPMRDGVLLYADVWRPVTDEPLPVLVSRTPYGRDMLQSGLLSAPPPDVARAGYAVVYQDCRGRFESEGDWEPDRGRGRRRLRHRRMGRGAAVVERAASGMFGASYMGYTQWLAAIARPPHLVAILPEVRDAEYWGTWFGTGGALRLAHRIGWAAAVGAAARAADRRAGARARSPARHAGAASTRCSPAGRCSRSATARWRRWSSRCSSTGRCATNPLLREDRTLDGAERFEHERSRRSVLPRARPPRALPHARPAGAARRRLVRHQRQRDDRELRRHVAARGHRRGARTHQRLIVGPWPHWTPQISVVGDVDFGPNAVLDLEPMRREWFGHWLQDQPAPMLDEPPVRIFVMGENVWRDECEWPLARTEWTSWYLHSGGHANTSDGDGVLGLTRPARRRHQRTRSSTTRATRCPPAAGGCSASAAPRGRPRSTSVTSRPATTCSCTRTHAVGDAGRDHRAGPRRAVGVDLGARHRLHRQARRRASPTAAPSTSATASSARGRSCPHRWWRARRTASPSSCGRSAR